MMRASLRSSSSSTKGKSFLMIFLFSCIAMNFIVTWIAGSHLEYVANQSTLNPAPPDKVVSKLRRPTMVPQKSSSGTVGFIHVGKTGGSTISQLLRNGCTSFVTSPCRNITNESIVSKKVEHYYHVPDFHRLPTSNHGSFIISVRDVYERTVSSFLYHHPKNAAVNNVKLQKGHEEYGPLAYSCFDTLDDFARLVNSIQNPADCNYPYRHNVVDATDCPALACASLHGKVRFFVHLFFNFRNILYTKLPTKPPRKLYVIRQEFLWSDWESLNKMWGQEDSVFIPPMEFNQRNITGLQLPVTKKISPEGRQLLCTALKEEYLTYFRILRLAINMDENDFIQSLQVAQKSCPNIDFQAMIANLGTRTDLAEFG